MRVLSTIFHKVYEPCWGWYWDHIYTKIHKKEFEELDRWFEKFLQDLRDEGLFEEFCSILKKGEGK